ncbi:hypothetical protein [Actinomyces culturomici]|uniref:hypothetical protein n=1 Tax=Actinomyces culturomici TaxID=1926276 RepID=UPI000E202AD0|nr:hypothetical protein [Actinomyces culturomici]
MDARISTGALTAVVVIAGLAIGSAINKALPSTSDVLTEPFVHEAGVGDLVDLRTGEVAATRVRTARSIVADGGTLATEGTWVVVDLDFTARAKPWAPGNAALLSASGREYSDPYELHSSCATGQSGVAQRCQIAVEVVTDDLPGLRLRIPAAPSGRMAGDDVALIDLEIAEGSDLVNSPEELVEVARLAYGEGDLG